MALTTIDSAGGSAARSVTAGLTKHGIDVKGKVVEGVLIASLATSLVILAVLIGDMVQRSWSVWTDRPVDFLSSGLSITDPSRPACGRGSRGRSC